MTNTQNTTPEAERVALVASPMLVKSTNTQQPATRKRAVRSSDEAIAEACVALVASTATVNDEGAVRFIPWVDALRTLRWTTGLGCDYRRFRPLYAAACEAYVVPQPKRSRKTA